MNCGVCLERSWQRTTACGTFPPVRVVRLAPDRREQGLIAWKESCSGIRRWSVTQITARHEPAHRWVDVLAERRRSGIKRSREPRAAQFRLTFGGVHEIVLQHADFDSACLFVTRNGCTPQAHDTNSMDWDLMAEHKVSNHRISL
jgi:hypothetical protein